MWNFSEYEKEIEKFIKRDFSVRTAAQKSSC